LKGSIINAGLDPDNLPESDVSKMTLGDTTKAGVKAWKEIWGCGQGIAAVKRVVTTQELVTRIEAEYRVARDRLSSF